MKKAIRELTMGQEFTYKDDRFRYKGPSKGKHYAACERIDQDEKRTAVLYDGVVVEVADE